jgi:hypothetical protein
VSGFEFVVRRLRWLARIPLAPQLFDTMLLVWTALFHRDRLRAIEAIEAGALRITGLETTVHRLGGIEFSLAGHELGHIHGNGLLDLRVGRAAAGELVAAHRALPHHVFGESAWISRWIRSTDDVSDALDLLLLAKAASETAASSDKSN